MTDVDRKAYQAEYYRKNRERLRAEQAKYRDEKKDELARKRGEWRDAHRDVISARNAAAYRANKERNFAGARRWKADHPDWVRIQMHRTRARRLGITQVHFTLAEFEARVAYLGNRCWICGTRENLTIDHLKPFSARGPHVLANIRIACGACNSAKGSKWYGARGIRRIADEVINKRLIGPR